MKAFLLDIRFSDFTLKDILQPKQDRLTAILSAIANYSMHSEAAWGSYEPIAEENVGIFSSVCCGCEGTYINLYN
jgi:hypothetical protein